MREADGRYIPPLEKVRSPTLLAAHAASILAIETVYPRIEEVEGLAGYVAPASGDRFTGMMAIDLAQVAAINMGFALRNVELCPVRALMVAFAANAVAGALKLDGKMIDQPHLVLAQRILDQAS
ncbi:hypothetical protein KFK14_05215 [Sphingobium phenoxybenzoativorans]|uniref:Uncharacterized protein n=1 Tax=Sphingobium phenoxybenzoativorans TaxID=1592790 RepID=A0A975K8M9_9SPHN|nr:hypothetical protein [Sphingobium phenoxybenzoativorans]QUT06841.1 hypothetical protein KFK14_05215 [Sphingobium phenoxybenzoativorans]